MRAVHSSQLRPPAQPLLAGGLVADREIGCYFQLYIIVFIILSRLVTACQEQVCMSGMHCTDCLRDVAAAVHDCGAPPATVGFSKTFLCYT
jgi:hypothetical protein